MSQLADLERVVVNTPRLRSDQKARLFAEILSVLDWEVPGIDIDDEASAAQAAKYLESRGHVL